MPRSCASHALDRFERTVDGVRCYVVEKTTITPDAEWRSPKATSPCECKGGGFPEERRENAPAGTIDLELTIRRRGPRRR